LQPPGLHWCGAGLELAQEQGGVRVRGGRGGLDRADARAEGVVGAVAVVAAGLARHGRARGGVRRAGAVQRGGCCPHCCVASELEQQQQQR